MRIIIFVPTLDDGPTGDKNVYSEHCGHFNHFVMAGKNHYIKHELDVPDSATSMIPLWHRVDSNTGANTVIMGVEEEIALPKPKVKKWCFAVDYKDNTFTTNHYTEEEVRTKYPKRAWYHKITETEREE